MPSGSADAVAIRAGSKTYDAVVGPAVVDDLGGWFHRAGFRGRPRIIADERVWAINSPWIEAGLGSVGDHAQVTLVGSGEEQKSLAAAERLYDWLIEAGTDRDDFIVAVGGGVVGDLAGFVAATYLRGLDLVQVPTTLLAMVDSSIGGKAAVNHPLGKNLIGAFHQPSLVLADTRFLRSLPPREYRSGWAEIVKVAMIADASLFKILRSHADSLLSFKDERVLSHVVRRAIELKGEVVGEDEREDGRRIILNYGHTIGHAVEAATGYSRYLHGEAVAIGMAGAATIARGRALLDEEAATAQAEVLARFGLPCRAEGVMADALVGPLSRDKKSRGKAIRWVLANGIGSVTTANDITPDELAAALTAVGIA